MTKVSSENSYLFILELYEICIYSAMSDLLLIAISGDGVAHAIPTSAMCTASPVMRLLRISPVGLKIELS